MSDAILEVAFETEGKKECGMATLFLDGYFIVRCSAERTCNSESESDDSGTSDNCQQLVVTRLVILPLLDAFKTEKQH